MLEKAKIKVLEGNGSGKQEITVMFNPEEYTTEIETKLASEGSNMQFDIVDAPSFTVSLFYDTYEKAAGGNTGSNKDIDVRILTDEIVSLMRPTVEGKEGKRPPKCMFIWGRFNYSGILSKVKRRFTMFLGNGTPVRAELEVTFRADLSEKEVEKNKGLDACRKLWMVRDGERLHLIAYKTLKDPMKWRVIAEANSIDNPVAFPMDEDIGRILVIPD